MQKLYCITANSASLLGHFTYFSLCQMFRESQNLNPKSALSDAVIQGSKA